MSLPEDNLLPKSSHVLDELVRAQLAAEGDRIDAREVVAQAFARLEQEEPIPEPVHVPIRRTWKRKVFHRLSLISSLAAAVLFLVFFFMPAGDTLATPTEIVAAARNVVSKDYDRCYRVTHDFSPAAKELFSLLAHGPTSRTLWTRGDRFVVEPGFGGLGAWGKNAAGHVWIATGKSAAARFEEEVLPSPLRNAVKIYELDLCLLLDEVLADFELSWTNQPGPKDEFYNIQARSRTEPTLFRLAAAELTIARKSKVIQGLTLKRKLWGNEVITIRFELQAEGTRPDSSYTPEGHIHSGAPVYDRTESLLRRRLLLQELGELLKGGL